MKKGAMFGLDARIALAIFGALSVISGASLYSAIQNAKVTATITELQELTKSLESYYLDTGSIPELHSTIIYLAKSSYLVDNPSITGWKGPYSPLKTHLVSLQQANGNDVHIIYARDNLDWSSITATEACNSSNTCYSWSRIYDHKSIYTEAQKSAIDKKIDNSDGADKGNFRWDANSINLKGIIVPSLN
tara:strand:- start:1109 stop:1678 length:570 start_codon:yes stop_codon:yes gene_type:complete